MPPPSSSVSSPSSPKSELLPARPVSTLPNPLPMRRSAKSEPVMFSKPLPVSPSACPPPAASISPFSSSAMNTAALEVA